LVETQAAGDAERIAGQMTRRHCDVLAVGGGDGTVNEVANGLMAAAAAAPGADLPDLAILPLGTANVLAREIGIGTDMAHAVAACLHGRKILLPMGRIHGVAGPRHFVMMAGVGFDAHVVRDVDKKLKRRIGKAVYALESLRQFWHYRPTLYRVEIDGAFHQAASVIVSRGRFYAGSYLCAPGADIAHAALHVCLFEKPGRLAVLRYGLALMTNRLPHAAGYSVIRAERVSILGPPGTPVQTDGDLAAATLPVSIDVAEQPLALLGPAG
jgi:YegS/Rv2252/BmrU family lipid kinase